MQVETDVHSCAYIRQEPKSGWSVGGADSPPSDARTWEDVEAQKVGQVDVEEQWPSDNIFGRSATGPTVSKVVTGQGTSTPERKTRSVSCSLEVAEEKCSRLRSMDRGGSLSGQTAPQQTPASLRRSQSTSEQQARGARLQSHKIAAQLTTGTPPGPNSKGVLLFNRRKERVNELTLSGPLDGGTGACVAEEASVPYFEQQASMEEEEVEEEAAGMENRRPEAGPEASAPGLGGPPAEAYLELQAEARREAEASVLARPPLPPPPPPLSKTGILEQSRLRKAGRRPMFTFHERPRLAPNPELLSLVHGTDVQRKAGGGVVGGGDEGLALGAEACTLGQGKAPVPAPVPGPAISAGEERPTPEWASCLKPPELRPPRRPGAPQGLAEVRGKGAELFARRQTRMERYTLEAPAPPPRPPSPTASLPAGWKCSSGGRSLVKPEASASNSKAAALPGRRQVSSASFVISPPARSPPPLSGPLTAKLSLPLPPPVAARPQGPRLNGFAAGEGRGLDSQPEQASPGHAPAPPAAPRPAEATQAPRPTFSARRAGLEAQQGWTSPVTPPWKAEIDRRTSIPRTYLDTIASDPASDAAPHSPRTPPCPLSPSAVVLSPNSWTPPKELKPSPAGKPGSEIAESRRLKDLLAKNVVIAARRKKLSSPTGSPSSPGEPPFPLSPRSDCLFPLSPHTPSPTVYVRSPLRLYRRSLTDSEFSLGSDDSGARSPSYHNFCPRGWTGSRAKQSEQ